MPTSVLWVTLIGVWLFVLVPMVLRGRPQGRKTTEAAANTRLVHRGGSARTLSTRTATRTRAAQRAAANAGEQADEARRKSAASADAGDAVVDADADVDVTAVDGKLFDGELLDGSPVTDQGLADVVEAEVVEADAVDSDVIEADVVEAEVVEAAVEPEVSTDDRPTDVVSAAELTDQIPLVTDDVIDIDEAQAGRPAEPISVDEDAEFEDAEFEDDLKDGHNNGADEAPVLTPREVRGRGGHGPGRPAERDELQYRERQRTVLGLGGLAAAAVVSAFLVQPWGIVAAVVMVAVFAAYLFILRKTVREEHVRQTQRAARRLRQQREDARLESLRAEPTYVEPPARLRRPGGAIVLEVDDEDPAFDHLPTYDFAYVGHHDGESEFEYDDLRQRPAAV